MRGSIIKGAIVGAIIAFLWSAISWIALPWHKMTLERFQNEQAVIDTIMEAAPKNGIYILPYGFGNQAEQIQPSGEEQMGESMTHPMVFASVNHGGMKKHVGPYIMNFIILFITAGLISWLLLQTKAMAFIQKALFVAIVGLTAGVVTYLPAWNWLGFPAGYVWVHIIDLTITWFLAGLAIAKVVKK